MIRLLPLVLVSSLNIQAELLDLNSLYKESAKKHEVPLLLAKAIGIKESSNKPKAVNPYDGGSPSWGIMQLKLNTARGLGFSGTVKELRDPKINIDLGCKNLKKHYDNCGTWEKAIVAYNVGHCVNYKNEYFYKVKFIMRDLQQ